MEISGLLELSMDDATQP